MMKKVILALVILVATIFLGYTLLASCGSGGTTAAVTTTAAGATTTTATGATTTTTAGVGASTVSGTVLVPASALSGSGLKGLWAKTFNVKATATTADDGVSNTALSGGIVQALDPVTLLPLSATAPVSATGTYNLTLTGSPSAFIIMAYKNNEDGTKTMVQAYGIAGSSVDVNAGTNMAVTDVLKKKAAKDGNLPAQATSIPTATKTTLIADFTNLYNTCKQMLGSLSQAPTLTYNASDVESIRKNMFVDMQTQIDTEYSSVSDSSLTTNYNSQLSSLQNNAEALISTSGIIFPTDLQITQYTPEFLPPNFAPGVLPPGMTITNVSSLDAELFFANLLSGLPVQTKFDCPIPPGLAGNMPSGSSVMDDAIFLGDWSSPDAMSNGMIFDQFPMSDLPPGSYLPSGTQWSGYSAPPVIPAYANYSNGFLMPNDVAPAPGSVLPNYMDYAPGFEMPSGVTPAAGSVLPSYMNYAPGYVPPSSGIQYEGGTPTEWQEEEWYGEWESGYQSSSTQPPGSPTTTFLQQGPPPSDQQQPPPSMIPPPTIIQ